MLEKVLGKISSASYGFNGDGMFGLSVTLSLQGGQTGVNDFKGWWAHYPEGAKYTHQEWEQAHHQATKEIMDLLTAAKKNYVGQLVGVPIQAKIEGNTLKSWRILTEVL